MPRLDLSTAISQIHHLIDNLSISDSSLTYGDWFPFNPPPASSIEEVDELSISIRNISQRLKRLDIYDISISDELFFPRTPSVDMMPIWDRLVMISLHYLPVTHSGEWLFLPDPDASSSSEEDRTVTIRHLGRAGRSLNRALQRRPCSGFISLQHMRLSKCQH